MTICNSPTCFISYSWDSEEQKDWVRTLAERLQKSGIMTRLDQWDLQFGMNVPRFMEENIAESDYVLMVCTPRYAERANSTQGGVGWEKQIITGEMYNQSVKENKFVPLLCNADTKISIPRFLQGKYYVDFSDDQKYTINIDALVRHLHNTPHHVRPDVGTPSAITTAHPAIAISRTVSKVLQETFELSDRAEAWQAAGKPYYLVEDLSKSLTALVRHPPATNSAPSEPYLGFLLLAGLHHGGNWLRWLQENTHSLHAIPIIFTALQTTYERVRFRALYALQYFDADIVHDAINTSNVRLGASVKDIVEQYVVNRQVELYLHKTAGTGVGGLADKARGVIREIEACDVEPPK